MYILGITGPISWNNAAAIVKDGRLIATAEEERFNGIKYSPRMFPKNAIKFCLKEANITFDDIDYIAVGFGTPNKFLYVSYASYLLKFRFKPFIKENNYVSDPFAGIDAYFTYLKEMRKLNDMMKGKKKEIKFIPHHRAHAASTFFVSGMSKANIITLDGRGENESTFLGVGENGRINQIETYDVHNSLGNLYSSFTHLLGFGSHKDEGKIMGLATYGKPVFDLDDVVKITRGGYRFDKNWFSTVANIVGRPRKPEEEITQHHKNLAASVQFKLEQIGKRLAEVMYDRTGIPNFCLAGGVALNCDMNAKILGMPFTKDIFIQPASHDAGTALGAAYELYSQLGYKTNFVMEHAYYGPEFSDEEIEKVLKESKAVYSYQKDIEGAVAEKLAKGFIVGWCQGKLELGPRALGNRSILANPSVASMKDKVNKEVKHRENWRPFAPSVLDRACDEYFENYYNSPFMLLTFDTKKKKQKELAAAIHIDGTARIQTVVKRINPKYYKMIEAFEDETGIPAVLNTSFNDAGDPIVLGPKEAIKTFYSTGLDYLAVGNFLLEKKKR